MIVAVAVCPPAPFLIPGIADNLLRAAGDLPDAVTTAVAALADADRIVVLASSPDQRHGRRLPPGSRLRAAGFGRSDRPPAPDLVLPGAPPTWPQPPAGPDTVVAGSLLLRAGTEAAIDVVEIAPGDPAGVAELLLAATDRIAVLAMADGSAAHGPRAPMAEDKRSGPTDARIAAALASGDPDGLAAAVSDEALPAALGVAGTEVFRVLARLPAPAAATVLHRSAPFGVGYLVATWSYGTAPPS